MTGGTANWGTYLSPNQPWGGPLTQLSDSYTQNLGTRGYALSNYSTPVKNLNFSGPITATFKWVPTNPNDPFELPPDSVIAVEKTVAKLKYSGILTGSYTIDNGIDPVISGTGITVDVASNGKRVTVKPGGATITLTCEPRVIWSYSTGPGNLNDAVANYSVDLIYPDLSFTGTIIDPNTNSGLAAPVGAGITSNINLRSVYNPFNGTCSGNWSGPNSDACNYFVVGLNNQYGRLEPFVSHEDWSDRVCHWYYYKGTSITGAPTLKNVSVAVDFSAEGKSTTATMTDKINLYGPVVDQTVTTFIGTIDAYADGGGITEDSGGIVLTNGGLGTSPPGFTFKYDSVQLCNISRVAGYNNTNTSGEFWLDNSYPYGIYPFSDNPMYGHTALTSLCAINDFFWWTGVCKPIHSDGSEYADSMWVNCAQMNWEWHQTNVPLWGNESGGITATPLTFGLVKPQEWENVFTNI